MTSNGLPTSVSWPAHWGSAPLWALFDRVKDVGHPNEEMLSVYREHGVVKKSSRDDNTNQTAEDRNIYQLIDEGWFVVNRMKAWQGSVGISPLKGIVSGHYLCFRPKHREDPRFLNWLLRSEVYALEYARMSRGVRPGQIEIDNDGLRGLRIALPPIDEQRRTTDFLNAEVSRNEYLERLLAQTSALLAERRRALLEHTIICEGPLRKLFQDLQLLRDGAHQPPPRTSTGVPLLTARNVSSGFLRLTDQDTLVSPADASTLEISFRPRHGDILLSVKGTIGATAIVPPKFPRAVLDRNLALLRPNPGLLSEWLLWALRSPNLQQQMNISIIAAAQPGLPLGAIRNLRIPSVDMETQKAQIKLIDVWDEHISDLESKISLQRELLAERRRALITAAVTGQIDVTTARGLD